MVRHKICYIISLFHASTCFEHHVLIVRRAELYYTAFGIITPVGGRPVHCPFPTCAPDGHLQAVVYRGGVWGVQPPPRNSKGPPKSCQTQPDCENC